MLLFEDLTIYNALTCRLNKDINRMCCGSLSFIFVSPSELLFYFHYSYPDIEVFIVKLDLKKVNHCNSSFTIKCILEV